MHVFSAPIVTKLEPLNGFYPAEDYHQDFAVTHPTYPYIVFNDRRRSKISSTCFRTFTATPSYGDGVEPSRANKARDP